MSLSDQKELVYMRYIGPPIAGFDSPGKPRKINRKWIHKCANCDYTWNCKKVLASGTKLFCKCNYQQKEGYWVFYLCQECFEEVELDDCDFSKTLEILGVNFDAPDEETLIDLTKKKEQKEP